MPLTVSVSLMGFAVLLALIPFLGLASRPLPLRVAVALLGPALVALQLFAPWDASPTWQLAYTIVYVVAVALFAVGAFFSMRTSPGLLPPLLLLAAFGVWEVLLVAKGSLGSPLSKPFWVGHHAPGRDLVLSSASALAVLAYWLFRRRERRAGH